MSNGFYKAYLQSDHWHEFRKCVLETKGRKCEDCGVTEGVVFDVHHLSYENLGDERLEDVIVLCHSCHMARHPEKNIIKNKCKHQNLIKSWSKGYTMEFYWECADCGIIISRRVPDEKEKICADKYNAMMGKFREQERIKLEKKEERRKAAKERAKFKPKKPKKKPKYRNPYKNKKAYRRSRLKSVNQ